MDVRYLLLYLGALFFDRLELVTEPQSVQRLGGPWWEPSNDELNALTEPCQNLDARLSAVTRQLNDFLP
jgi:hypothetical protein